MPGSPMTTFGCFVLDTRSAGSGDEVWTFWDRTARVSFTDYGDGAAGFPYTGAVSNGKIRRENDSVSDDGVAISCYATFKGISLGQPETNPALRRFYINAFAPAGGTDRWLGIFVEGHDPAGPSEIVSVEVPENIAPLKQTFSSRINLRARYFITLVWQKLPKIQIEGFTPYVQQGQAN